ncbi:RNA ligase RtcB family protein [Iodobacter arcticus]|uniref:3'-phosphate/5'-hydroxy nucleic acid ligase n=1 Tax=Iodobacter arcticus TaxID=590593 RepID=A0ABW2R3Y7_9NEIS
MRESGGNHFAELQSIDEVYDAAVLDALAINKQQLQLLVHSGSRGLGQFILRQHIEQHGHRGLAVDTADCAAYLLAHQQAVQFATLNRRLIAQRILLRLSANGQALLDINHNLVLPAQMHGLQGWVHRKGATPADVGPVVIPGSRGDFSYLVLPLASDLSLNSLAHGAGRKWIRSECKGRLSPRYTVAQLSRTKLGSHVICADRQLIYEEAPEAYKPAENIISTLEGAGLIKVIARLRPVLTYKTRGECCE